MHWRSYRTDLRFTFCGISLNEESSLNLYLTYRQGKRTPQKILVRAYVYDCFIFIFLVHVWAGDLVLQMHPTGNSNVCNSKTRISSHQSAQEKKSPSIFFVLYLVCTNNTAKVYRLMAVIDRIVNMNIILGCDWAGLIFGLRSKNFSWALAIFKTFMEVESLES